MLLVACGAAAVAYFFLISSMIISTGIGERYRNGDTAKSVKTQSKIKRKKESVLHLTTRSVIPTPVAARRKDFGKSSQRNEYAEKKGNLATTYCVAVAPSCLRLAPRSSFEHRTKKAKSRKKPREQSKQPSIYLQTDQPLKGYTRLCSCLPSYIITARTKANETQRDKENVKRFSACFAVGSRASL